MTARGIIAPTLGRVNVERRRRIASLWLGRPGNEGLHELKVMTPDGVEYAMVLTEINFEDIGCGG